jgi:hypothetical protein
VSSSNQRGLPLRPGPAPGQRLGEQHALGRHLRTGVAGADHDERGAGRALGLVRGGVGHLDLPGDVVAQEQRLGDAAEAVGVFGDAGHRKQLVDAAGGDDQPVVTEAALAALRVEVGQRASVEVEAVHLAEDDLDSRQRPGQRDGDPPRLEDPGGHLGQQRQVQEVVGGVDDDDLRRAAGCLGQRAGGLEAGETGSDDDDPGAGHSSPSVKTDAQTTLARLRPAAAG